MKNTVIGEIGREYFKFLNLKVCNFSTKSQRAGRRVQFFGRVHGCKIAYPSVYLKIQKIEKNENFFQKTKCRIVSQKIKQKSKFQKIL